ncbi:NAD(P)/FAD-dependent oxidoreductase [Paenibacillus yanchengensis]|uniref:NAD(P)/FAD-dependent oxidoreductase n=1 Tax=Paenibacillus yanchengensis TaxID=2035833 RepID=A0ABW4YI18_9BACL
MNNHPIVVVGAGSAGLMASIAASKNGAKVILIDKGDKLGRKLGISGGGRCNVTNAKETDELIKNIPGNGRYLYSALSQFGNTDIIHFFESLGIKLKEEDNGRMFPISDKAKTVVDTLVNQVKAQGVTIMTNSPVAKVLYNNGAACGVLLKNGQSIAASAVIVAVGGKSVPKTGSTGDGYPWAIEAGHTITDLFPTEVPLTSQEPFIIDRQLQGLSLRDVTLSIWNEKEKKLISHEGDMIFTHFGLSGPIALRCSQFVVKQLKKNPASSHVLATIDLFPQQTIQDVFDLTYELAGNEPKKAMKNVLKAVVPDRLLPLIFTMANIEDDITYDHINKQKWQQLAILLKALPVNVNGTLSIEDAFVTGGGVHLKEIEPKTMESKLTERLFFCGEILDIHGYTGGYNITAAFSTGHAAGTSAAQLYS